MNKTANRIYIEIAQTLLSHGHVTFDVVVMQ